MRKNFKQLTIYLLKRSISSLEQAADLEGLNVERVEASELPGKLRLIRNNTTPHWLAVFADHFPLALNSENTATSLVWVTEASNRLFAVCFGPASRFKLRKAAVQRGFGLRTVLNSIDPNSILETGTFDSELAIRLSRQSAKPRNLSKIGLRIVEERVESIRGIPLDQSFAKQAVGADGLRLFGKFNISEVVAKLREAYEYFEQQTYKKNFPFIEKMLPVEEENVRSDLDTALFEKIEMFDEVLSIGFVDVTLSNYDPPGKILYKDAFKAFSSLDISDLYSFIESHSLKKEHLKAITIKFTGDKVARTLKEILTATIELNSQSYVLHVGQWYTLESDAIGKVDRFVECLPSSGTNYLKFDPTVDHDSRGLSEHKYNLRLAPAIGGECLDGKTIQVQNSAIEPCDVLVKNRKMYHLKRGTTSARLSHLFRQGINSAMLSLNSVEFRKKLPSVSSTIAEHTPGEPKPHDLSVIFAVVSGQQGPLAKILPLHAKLSLRSAINEAVELGISYFVDKIEVQTSMAELEETAEELKSLQQEVKDSGKLAR